MKVALDDVGRRGVKAIRVLGLLLFGKDEALRRLLLALEVAFQVLRGQAVEVADFFRWPLLRVMEEIEARFRARNREQELLVGLLRVGVPDYPPAAFREGLANALIHRDYTRMGAVHIQWREDRIEIYSVGTVCSKGHGMSAAQIYERALKNTGTAHKYERRALNHHLPAIERPRADTRNRRPVDPCPNESKRATGPRRLSPPSGAR